MSFTKFLLDSGDPDEYREIAVLAKKSGNKLWGSTTNPSLIAKKLSGKKVSQDEAFNRLQKEIVMEILDIVPGAVSAEVYSNLDTKAEEMIAQGREIATWHERVVVKLPITIEGLKARTTLRKSGIPINNTLVFSQQQIFAILMHETLVQNECKPRPEDDGPLAHNLWPPFISPFVGRLDDRGENGMDVVEHGLTIQKKYFDETTAWILESSVRSTEHVQLGLELNVPLMTSPAKVYRDWFGTPTDQRPETNDQRPLAPIPYWQPLEDLLHFENIDDFMEAIISGRLDISHPFTTAGVEKFAEDWSSIILSSSF